MRVLVAGATGAIGRPLLPLLVAAGHSVVGTTRSEEKAAPIRAAGAEAAIADVLDRDALRREVHRAGPEIVINQLTSLPDVIDPRDRDALVATNRLRGEVGRILAQTAADAGAKRLISQSVAFFYAPTGGPVKTEDDPILELPPESQFGAGVQAQVALERATLGTLGIEGVVLRYGYFYGPGTQYSTERGWADAVRRRRFPVIGDGSGVFSFIHVDDAATATVAAVERAGPGVYNVVDDDPAPMSEWLPIYAEALGSKPPRRVPAWLARVFAGRQAVMMATAVRGASNEKAKRELGWEPKYPSWRQGFREALG